MIRITDQYFWNFVFGLFFLALIIMGAIILETETRIPFDKLTLVDFTLITLSSWRLTQLFLFDHITKWFREQFYNVKKVGKGYLLEKPKTGPRRTIADFLSYQWVFTLWMSAVMTFVYLLTPYAYYFAIFLALSVVASFLQNLSSLITAQTNKINGVIE